MAPALKTVVSVVEMVNSQFACCVPEGPQAVKLTADMERPVTAWEQLGRGMQPPVFTTPLIPAAVVSHIQNFMAIEDKVTPLPQVFTI